MPQPDGSARLGLGLVALGLALVAVTFGVGWATAPDVTAVTPEADPDNASTVIGVQGPGPGGSVDVVDGHGAVRWTYGDAISYQDVTHLDDGTVLATFADDGYNDCGPYASPCKHTGVRIIDPTPEPHIVREWSYPVRTRKDSEVHDAEPLPSGEVLVADMEYERVFAVNLTTGERTWTWNASDRYKGPADPTRSDWLHINDVDRIGDGRYLVSVRNANQLLVVELGAGVVEVVNEDRDPALLNKQHNPQWLGDGAVLVADSENDRVVELHRNESTGAWEVAWLVTEADGLRLDWPRDADRLPNGHTLITDSRNDRLVEVAPNGSLVASYPTAALPYEADRVPVGEAGGRPHGVAVTPGAAGLPRQVPVLSPLLAALHHVVGLPVWLTEVHLGAVLLAAGLWVGGAYLVVVGARS